MVNDFSDQIMEEIDQPFFVIEGPHSCLRQIDHQLKELLGRMNLGLNQISAIGIFVPGPVMYEAGMVSSPPIMSGWDEFPISNHLEELW
jgi:predicted NBD/HSP70 family sugar kinase